MTDLILNAGPVMTAALRRVPWRRPTRIVDIECRGGACAAIAHATDLALLEKDQGGTGKLCLSGFSAGGYFMNPLLKEEENRVLVDAVIAMDAAFADSAFEGYAAFGAEAARGQKLFVITTGPHPNAWNTVLPTWRLIEELSGLRTRPVSRVAPMPEGPAHVAQIGEACVWYHYPSVPHGGDAGTYDQFDMMADAWEAYLVPYFAPRSWTGAVGAASLATLAFAGATLLAR